jgi:TfoX/Sxy family transcriptional regulator of competence genes
MSSSLLVHLKGLLDGAAGALPGVTWRRMFGCDAAFATDQIFGLIWKEGRIGLKLPEASAELLAQPGAAPWAPGGSPMRHWVLLPEELHDDEEELARWVARAHSLALKAPPKPDKKAKKTPKSTKPAPKSAKPAPKSAKPAAKKTSRPSSKGGRPGSPASR